jgi:hypothetical protein
VHGGAGSLGTILSSFFSASPPQQELAFELQVVTKYPNYSKTHRLATPNGFHQKPMSCWEMGQGTGHCSMCGKHWCCIAAILQGSPASVDAYRLLLLTIMISEQKVLCPAAATPQLQTVSATTGTTVRLSVAGAGLTLGSLAIGSAYKTAQAADIIRCVHANDQLYVVNLGSSLAHAGQYTVLHHCSDLPRVTQAAYTAGCYTVAVSRLID